jgi:hypothetical protein
MKIRSFTNQKENNRIEIDDLSEEDKDKFLGMVNGMWWVRGQEGVPVFFPAFKRVPNPIEDPRMNEFWPQRDEKTPKYSQIRVRDYEEYKSGSPSITIQSLCGYDFTPEKYAKEVTKLRSYGFSCLRSPRSRDGKYYEHWYLSGLWSAQGNLEWEIKRIKQDQEQDQVPLEERDSKLLDGVINFFMSSYQLWNSRY